MRISFTTIIAFVLIFLGIFINFIPTIIYYTQVYPKIPLNRVEPGAYFTYVVQNLAIPLKSTNDSDFLLSISHALISVTVMNNNSYKVTINGSLSIYGYDFEKTYIVESSFVLNSSNPFIKMLFVSEDKPIALVGNRTIVLKINPRYYTFNTFGGLDPYSAEFTKNGGLIYYILFSGDKLVLSNLFVGGLQPNDTLYDATHIVWNLLQHVNKIRELTSNMSPLFNETLISIDSGSSNVKTINNLFGEIEWDFSVTYFPINIVMILIGMIIIILKFRGKLS
ncbi:hypothetical protein [Sulfurisphaera tokodaii]|uniref:Uncharacterized protein n=2 Tax=Sulfurisphaera tokodaii TaxID=111955 RepID=Q96ZV6_SULTO|nr:hypothetical protein [Sulfurisphaera tokodaii]BAB66817.1 hypothetical protein STK_17290 [Sulfurisphaera tokodaii str. 7]HII73346.1 hypothetical protein [Sulfurisphaera tokodaii]